MNKQVLLLAALAGVAVYFIFGGKTAEESASNVDHVDSEAGSGCGCGDGGCQPHCPAQGNRGVIPDVPESVTAAE